ncbi:Type 1 glutamine amidotransferase-like domain-containing protein [Ktedonobacter racemifer]|uniref:Peptidase S51 dipeptidase E n=1 Tax=Ktedonobacter racemifer DSM 44963 TaxID=485913 RepID=D6TY47_KTERA|nr:Type 1 glutamine amidotransferase-like domain-containing protein [Ktedonobacter racemifer]EFH85043.1 peptidase S51 dipeptidase E [Ktedonobacter racemifer DSM 44963]
MKRILLTSKGFATEAIEQAFFRLFPVSPLTQKVAFIPTAAVNLKGKHPFIIEAKNQFIKWGFKTTDVIDIECDNVSQLKEYDIIYIGGGNPFYLLEHLRNSGADEVITRKAASGGMIVGVSAGAIVLGPHLEIVQHFTPALRTITKLENTFALGLFSFLFMPHVDRADVFPGQLSIEERLQIFERGFHVKVKRLKDHEALLLRGEEIVKIG